MADDPTARTLKLLGLLQAHRFWKGSELAERLGVSERTVRRDVDRLRELGYSVDASTGVDGGYQLAPGKHLPPLLVDDDEAIALALGLQTAAVASVQGIEETTVRIMAKLEQILPERLRRQVEAVRASVDVMRWSPTAETIPPATLTMLTQGCRSAEEVRFDYQRRDGEESRRLVEPHHLVSVGRRWYLVAWDLRRDGWRIFRVDRMGTVTLAGRRFTPRPLPADDAASFVAESLRSSRPADHRAVVVVVGSPSEVRGTAGWLGADLTELGEVEAGVQRFRLELGAQSADRLVTSVAILAAGFAVELESAGEDVRRRLASAASRLGAMGE